MSSFDAELESLIHRLQAKYGDIVKYRGELKWRFLQASAPGAHQAGYDDSSWKNANLPLQVNPQGGESWLRCIVTVPEEVALVGVSGSTAQLPVRIKETSQPYVLGNSAIYVNSRKVISAKYWTELRIGILLNERVKPGEKYTVAIHLLPYHEPVSVPPLSVNYSQYIIGEAS